MKAASHRDRPFSCKKCGNLKIAALAAAIFCCTQPLAYAQSAPDSAGVQAFDIPAQPLATALREFARQSGQDLLFSPDVAAEKATGGIKGTLPPLEALSALLQNTGIRFSTTSNDAILLRNNDAQAAQTSAGLTTSVPVVSSKGESSGQTSPVATSGQITELDTIVVTAQKREERLIDTPQSVSVITADELAKLNATQFRDYATTIPGLSLTTEGPGIGQITLRGVTSGNTDLSSTVAQYVDEVPYGSAGANANGARITLDIGLADLDRIEVLRGPQGTLYGASSMGGLVKYVTKLPDATTVGGSFQAGVSTTREGGVGYDVAGSVNIPISPDKLALRASAYQTHDGGFVDNVALGKKDVNRADIYGGRLDLLFTPTDDLSVRIVGFLQNIDRDGQGTVDHSLAGVPAFGGLAQSRGIDEDFAQEFRLVSSTIEYDMGGAKLTSVSGYQTVSTDFIYDYFPTFGPAINILFGIPAANVGLDNFIKSKIFTQEIRLASDGTRPLEWQVGGFYTNQTNDSFSDIVMWNAAGQPLPSTVLNIALPDIKYKEYAVFGDLTWHITDKFDVTGGARYAENEQSFQQNTTGLLQGSGSTPRRGASEGVSTYLANARYRFSNHATAYLRYATGYRPGGPNAVLNDANGQPLAPPSYEADKLQSYEAGFKAETADRRFGIDLAAYNINWDNFQFIGIREGFAVRTNVNGGATIKGAEVSAIARPVVGLEMSGSFAFQDATLSDDDADLVAKKGSRLPNVPRYMASFLADYGLPGGIEPSVGLTVRYVSDRSNRFDPRPITPAGRAPYHLPGYTSVDLRVGAVFGIFKTQLYVRNLFDKRGQISAPRTIGLDQVAIQQPRTFGISVRTDF